EQGVKRIESPPELKALPQAQSSRGDLTLALFDMASFHFAVSVDKLAGIQVIADELLITPDTPSWMLGKLGKGKNAMVILDPRGFSDKNLDHSGHTPQSLLGKKLVVIAGGRYAFISDHVDKVQEVQADTIKWNNHPENRPWLSGVVMADALAILDAVRIEEIANQWLRSR
ncbi:MAG: hypothetical protein OEX00_10860, partial [Gammaproteobacteria bacterium]|nr:hypothetical protein [Gammaproteobacteria bacterium]